MIKRYAIKKIMVSTLCLVLLLMFYFFPTHETINTEININNKMSENVIYLLDNDNYVARVVAYFDNKSIEDEINKKLDILINGSEELKDFYSVIPKNTKINSIKVDKNSVYIDFDKNILTVNKYLEEHMIESIVYTLTEINGIDNIYLSVEGEELKKLPNSNMELPYPLTRSYGINKEYNITNFNNISKTTVFFSRQKDNYNYYVPVTKVSNDVSEKIDIIIYELKSVVNSQNNLNSFLNDNTKLVSYSKDNNKLNLVFNNYIFSNDKVLEEVEYVISSSIFENYDVDEVNISDGDNSVTIFKN